MRSPSLRTTPPAGGWRGLVLIIDDDDDMRLLGSMVVQRLGYAAVVAGNVKESIARFNERYAELSLVILDYRMPPETGIDIWKRLKVLNLRGIPGVLMSGSSQNGAVPRMAAEHGLSFLDKPFTVPQLRAILEQSSLPNAALPSATATPAETRFGSAGEP